MNHPKVSVIIPTYNHANFISTAIRSVLAQTFTNFELIIVDDGSTDHTSEVVDQFQDKRIKYIYQENRGLPAARNTGIRVSSSDLLAFLDADDQYHPNKLKTQLDFMENNPEIGLSYNSRITIDSSGNYLLLIRAPVFVTLADLVLNYPFTINDIIVRRTWAYRVGLFDESFVLNSEDLNFYLRLALEGCKFAGIIQALTYRMIHTGRILHNLPGKMDTFLRALNTAFDDPRCPLEVQMLRKISYATHYLFVGYHALMQGDILLGQEFLREAVRLNPSILDDKANRFLEFLIHISINDNSEPEIPLRMVFTQLPPELAWLSTQCNWAIGRGYLEKGVRDVIWGRLEIGKKNFERAFEFGVRIDERFLRNLTEKLLNYEEEFGTEAAQNILQNISSHLEQMGGRGSVRWLIGCYSVNRAFQNHRLGKNSMVFGEIIQAISNNPRYLFNRGVIAIIFRLILDRTHHL